MLETKEQIRTADDFIKFDLLLRKHGYGNTFAAAKEYSDQQKTELINELIEKIDVLIKTTDGRDYTSGVETAKKEIISMLPTETPEKIAERKAKETIKNAKKYNPHEGVASYIATNHVEQMLIEALLTDIKK